MYIENTLLLELILATPIYITTQEWNDAFSDFETSSFSDLDSTDGYDTLDHDEDED